MGCIVSLLSILTIQVLIIYNMQKKEERFINEGHHAIRSKKLCATLHQRLLTTGHFCVDGRSKARPESKLCLALNQTQMQRLVLTASYTMFTMTWCLLECYVWLGLADFRAGSGSGPLYVITHFV